MRTAISFVVLLVASAPFVLRADNELIVTAADREFIDKAAASTLAEIEMGRLAASRGQTAEIRQFGRHMMKDHSKVNTELSALAGRKGIALPTSMSTDQQQTCEQLASLSGDAFDDAYIDATRKDLDSVVGEFRREASAVGDPDLRRWVTRTLGTLHHHEELAHHLVH